MFHANHAHRLLVASQEGYLYVYQVASVEGGDCRLIIRHDLRTLEQNRVDGSPPADAASLSSQDAVHGMSIVVRINQGVRGFHTILSFAALQKQCQLPFRQQVRPQLHRMV